MVFDLSIADPLQRIKAFWSLVETNDQPSWGANLTNLITPLTAILPTPHTCVATYLLDVTPELCNMSRNLHGGCSATIFDVLTSVAIAPVAEKGKFSFGGVSRTLNCTYLRPVPEGSKVIVNCEVLALSGRLAATRGTMREAVEVVGNGECRWEERGPILVTCEHGKVNTDAKL